MWISMVRCIDCEHMYERGDALNPFFCLAKQESLDDIDEEIQCKKNTPTWAP